ncbi:HAD family hydrolase [Acidobacteriota bacterium]
MSIKGIYFDFGYVIGCPTKAVDRKYLYLDWDGIDRILMDDDFSSALRKGVGRKELTNFFTEEIYEPYLDEENSCLEDPQSYKTLVERLPQILSSPVTPQLVDMILAHLDIMKYFEICENVPELLTALKERGLRISIVSNMMLPGSLLVDKLQREGLIPLINTVTVSSDVGYIKPHPRIFWITLKEDGLEPSDVMFVGDTYHQDIVGAKGVGMKTAWLNIRNEPADWSRDNPPDHEIKDLNQVLDLL